MGDESFNEKILVEKLTKLNNSQQSIESLSKWCVNYRKKAKQVVEIWEKSFKSTSRERRVSLLYLSNDILQNSRRKGSEFVNEFWKVLPAALKDIYDSGDENCRKIATRLIEIWEERKVFGSRGQNLKSEVMGHPAPVNAVRNPNLIKIVKRDANSVRLKLAVGGLPEKIMTAMHTVHEEVANEETALDKCHKAISSIQEIDKDAMNASAQGKLIASDVVDQLQKQEDVIQQAMIQFQKSEENRIALISQLREALQDEESKMEAFRSERLAAQSQIEHAANIKLRATSASSTPPITNHSTSQQMTTTNLPPTHTTIMSPPTNSNQEDSKKAAAASMAAKLAASTSSAQMLTSILSSLAAEEAASKRPKTDHPPFSDAKNPSEGSNNPAYFLSSQQMTTNVPVFQSSSSASSQLHAPFIPPPPPPVVQPIANQPLQPNLMGLPYNNYGAGNLYPQPPPPSSGSTMGFARPGVPPQQAPPPPPQTQQQQPPGSGGGGYLGGLGVGFYGQSHQSSTPPIHRQ